MGTASLSVHQLRSRWKPIKERLIAAEADQSTAIRLHRAFSWLQRVEQFQDGQDADLALVCQWIALNSLYGQWNTEKQEPLFDRDCWRRFVDRLLAIDASNHLGTALTEQRDLVMAVLDDEYLSAFFWRDPSDIQASKSKRAKFEARTWYLESKWGMVLDRLLERIHLLRCQLVHGAATFGSQLNRDSLGRCVQMMDHLLVAVLLVIIDHGAEQDWGAMCYPPLGDGG